MKSCSTFANVLFWLLGVLLFSCYAIAAENKETPWPFDQPSLQTLRASSKKVFAHYFLPFPISIDNRAPEKDYYTWGYLSRDGENKKHAAYGGYLRERPLPRPQRPEDNWRQLDMDEEVRRASAIGLDGFVVDILSSTGNLSNGLKMLLASVQRVDPTFKILLMPDMTAEFRSHPENLAGMVREVAKDPALYRLPDGRLVIAPYCASVQSAAWWKDWLGAMKAEGIDIALVPLFQGWRKFAADFSPVSYGMSDWGPRSPSSAEGLKADPAEAHKYAPIWMMPVSPQDFRPKNSSYWEAANSLTFRTMWKSAIEGGADWVQLITWNDYSETTEISPSTGTQYTFYDLTAYYTTWFKTGKAPKITRDVLYYFHRNQPTTAQPDSTMQTKTFHCVGGEPARDEVELLAFLTKPGTLEIDLGGATHRMDAPTGITSFRIPLANGRPVFRLIRKKKTVITLQSGWEITDHITIQDALYRGGCSSRPFIPFTIPVTEPGTAK